MTLGEIRIVFGNDPKAEDNEEEEELQDPMDAVKEECQNSSKCESYREELDVCTDRVNSRSQTEEHCTQELFDFLHCADSCVANNLFDRLK